ncbi:LCP family protein [Streptomyces sp. NPDC127084]|uniref:LCP family protein n=1 Tax=Streptomyces sp. NPDC127084 TaxID=3347133 RepID=UPI0036623D53
MTDSAGRPAEPEDEKSVAAAAAGSAGHAADGAGPVLPSLPSASMQPSAQDSCSGTPTDASAGSDHPAEPLLAPPVPLFGPSDIAPSGFGTARVGPGGAGAGIGSARVGAARIRRLGIRSTGGPGLGDSGNGGNGSGDSGGSGGSGGDGSGGTGRNPGPGPRRRHRLRWAALAVSVAVLAVSAVSWWFYRKLDSNITTDLTAAQELARYDKERPLPAARGALNLLLIGSDTRAGSGNGAYGKTKGQRSDTTILLHLARDRRSVTAVSVPRDLMVTVPSCRTPGGTRTAYQVAQFNSAFSLGGAACTIRTVERLTGIRLDHHMVVDFRGFKDMVDAVDGVTVCLKKPIDDQDAHLKLKAGRQTLNGEQALGFVRARKTLGNGSDTERMGRQQQFLGALVKKVQSDGVLLNPAKLYPVLDAATKSITTDPGLNSLKDLFDLTRALRNVPMDRVRFLTVPRQPYAQDPNRDALVEPKASQLFERLREDQPVVVAPAKKSSSNTTDTTDSTTESDQNQDGTGSAANPSATPTFTGSSAASGGCA